MEHKLKSQSGETLVETLFAMLIVVLSITMQMNPVFLILKKCQMLRLQLLELMVRIL